MREQPLIAEKALKDCLQEAYGLSAVTLEFLPLGLDYNAGVYRVLDERGTAYFLKAKAGSLYEPMCVVPRYLYDQGISAVVAPLPTKRNTLWSPLGDWNVIVYPFIDGESSVTGMTDEQWRKAGAICKQIHQTRVPSSGFESLRRETFDPAEYVRWVRDFEAQHTHAIARSDSERLVLSTWRDYRSIIDTAATSLEKLARPLQGLSNFYVICHADMHAANMLRTQEGDVFVIDWDDVMLATKEHDFIFLREPQADAFWQGYGSTEIDWRALTYYLWERVVQDVIVCTQNAFRADLGVISRASEAQLLHETLIDTSGYIAAAYAAATHLS